jgi:hypothetical protein
MIRSSETRHWFTIAALWNTANLFVTGFAAGGLQALLELVRSGRLTHPALLLVLVGTVGHFLMIVGATLENVRAPCPTDASGSTGDQLLAGGVKLLELRNPYDAIREAGDDLQFATHGFHETAQRAHVHVCPVLHLRDLRLSGTELFCELLLRELPRPAKLIQRHRKEEVSLPLRDGGTPACRLLG